MDISQYQRILSILVSLCGIYYVSMYLALVLNCTTPIWVFECLKLWKGKGSLFFFWISLRLSWFCGFVPGLREWPRKTNISVRGEGEAQYIPNPKPTCACNQLISWKSWNKSWTNMREQIWKKREAQYISSPNEVGFISLWASKINSKKYSKKYPKKCSKSNCSKKYS